MDLRELVDGVDVPDTRVADEAWDRARRRLRRRWGWSAGAAGALVAATLVGAAALVPDAGLPRPAPATTTPDPTPSRTPGSHLPLTIIKPDWEALAAAPALAPPADAPALSADPVDHAALVIGDAGDEATAYVLGDDGRWRRIDVPGLVPMTEDGVNSSPFTALTALDPTGTRMAIPQPGSLVVVDLTTGESRRYDVSGIARHYAVWVDDTQVLVAVDQSESSVVLDLATGNTEASPLDPSTRFLPDGSMLSWPWPGSDYTWNGVDTSSPVNNDAAFTASPPLVRDGRGVVVNNGYEIRHPAPEFPPQRVTSTIGIAAVDLASGDPIGYVQLTRPLAAKGTYSMLLGWRGSDPVLGLVNEQLSSIHLIVVAWDVDAGTLAPIATLPSWLVVWGVGL